MTVAHCAWSHACIGTKEVGRSAAHNLVQQLVVLEGQIPDPPPGIPSKDVQVALRAVRSMLLPLAAMSDSTDAEPSHHAAKRAGNAPFQDGPLGQHPVVTLMGLAEEKQLPRVHSVLCMYFASLLDNSSAWTLSEAFTPEGCVVGSCGLLQLLSERSALGVMAHISLPGLDRVLKICPPWESLLSCPEARTVFEKRMHPVGELFEVLLHPYDGNCFPNVSWKDAYELFSALLSGSVVLDPLPLLLGSTLEKIAMQAPQHLGHLTMFTVLLHAIEAGAQQQMPGPTPKCMPPSQASAEVFFGAVKHLHSSLRSRLARIAACTESTSSVAPTDQMATEYFATLSQSRELLSRAQELAAVSFPPEVATVFQRQVSRLADGLLLNFGVSDRAVALAATLPAAIAVSHPAIGRLLSAMFFRVLPEQERGRLGLALPTVKALDEGLVASCKISFLCQGGMMTSEVPFSLLKTTLGRMASHVRLFWKWRAMHKSPVDYRAAFVEEEALLGAPLNVSQRAFNEVLDFARIDCMTSVIGDCSAQQRQFKHNWFEQVASSSPATRESILQCALVVGSEEIVQGLCGCSMQTM